MTALYTILLTLHNLNRWLVLITGVWAIVQNIAPMRGTRPYTPAEARPVTLFMGTLHLQVVLGLLLYGFLGSMQAPVFAGAKPGFVWQHLVLGVLAAVFATLGRRNSRLASGPQAQARAALYWCALALVCVLLAIPWYRPLLRLFGL